MVSAKLFEAVPAFPENLPVFDMNTISLAKLARGDEAEAAAILDACRSSGFFLLDLTGEPTGLKMINELEQMFDVVRKTMALSDEIKDKYQSDPPRTFLGYKSQGAMKTETGQPDRCEFYNIAQDDLLGNISERPAPETVQESRTLLRSYVEHGQYALGLILKALASQLELPEAAFRELQPANRESGTIVRMIRYPASVRTEDMRTGLLPHTDFGSVTLLANVLGGLQVLRPGAEPEDDSAWLWIRPQPGCLIVNMGDAMVEWTGGVLRSNMHRVSFSPGEQRLVDRISVALLVRPFKEARMSRLVGGRIPLVEEDKDATYCNTGIDGLTAFEWEIKKSMALRSGKDCAKSRGGRELRATA